MRTLPPLRLLATFAEIARTGSMRDAAQSLNVSQPAVTQALRALEEHVGASL
ncbi:MAG: LysR family transcriptional regulator, partial [Pseudomonadota bacterium]